MLGSDDNEQLSAPWPDPDEEERSEEETIEDILNETVFLDDRMRIIQPTTALRASAAITDYIIDPVSYMAMMMSMLAYGIYVRASHLWLKIPRNIRTWMKWIIVSIVIAMIVAALGIHAWDKPDHDTDTASTPDMEWYSRDVDFINWRVHENRADIVSCISNVAKRPRVHVFTAFDAPGKMYRIGVNSFAEISMISAAKIERSWEVTDLQAAPVRLHFPDLPPRKAHRHLALVIALAITVTLFSFTTRLVAMNIASAQSIAAWVLAHGPGWVGRPCVCAPGALRLAIRSADALQDWHGNAACVALQEKRL